MTEVASGDIVIRRYLEGQADGAIIYNKLCCALDLLERWKPEAIAQFLNQFIEIGSVLDYRCKQLVNKFLKLEWQSLPAEIRPRFVKMLRDIAVHHVCYTEAVLKCFVDHLQAKIRPVKAMIESKEVSWELKVSSEEQEEIYQMSHEALSFMLTNFPTFSQKLPKIIRHSYPHHSLPFIRYTSFVINLLKLCSYVRTCRGEILSVLISELGNIDALIVRNHGDVFLSDVKSENCIFLMDEDSEQKSIQPDQNIDEVQKLDACMTYFFTFIAKTFNVEIPETIDASIKCVIAGCPKAKFMEEMLAVFEENLLMAHSSKYVAFLWFYMCNLDRAFRVHFIEWIWSFVTHFSNSPNTWKKAHGAACYIGSLLSRASFIDLNDALKWMEILLRWCTDYVNEMVDRSVRQTLGSLRHGTFYAVFQAFILIFSFRYQELVDSNEINTVRKWGIGHVIHSKLEPLVHISYPVALCFASISRSLQLIYCNHIISNRNEEKLAFEPFYPFDDFHLQSSSVFVNSLRRKFSPLSDYSDGSRSKTSFHSSMEFDEKNLNSWNFLEDIARDNEDSLDDAMESIENTISPQKNIGEFLTCYSKSPGLKQFKVG